MKCYSGLTFLPMFPYDLQFICEWNSQLGLAPKWVKANWSLWKQFNDLGWPH